MNPGSTFEHRGRCADKLAQKSPFLLENESEYRLWRARKLDYRQLCNANAVFKLDQNMRFEEGALEPQKQQLEAFNFFLFESADILEKQDFLSINQQFGLFSPDSNLGADAAAVTSLRVVGEADELSQYIPYTNRALNWHTDGYYNPASRQISAFALYCVTQAEKGGGNFFFDHELMYLLIRDSAPELLEALMCPDLMEIPANIQGNRIVRAQESGSVFSIGQESGILHMRYTSRPRNIVWKSDKLSQRALKLIREILMDSDAVIGIRLNNRQGVVCNNVLHGRRAFHDYASGPSRLYYRARYYQDINPDHFTGMNGAA